MHEKRWILCVMFVSVILLLGACRSVTQMPTVTSMPQATQTASPTQRARASATLSATIQPTDTATATNTTTVTPSPSPFPVENLVCIENKPHSDLGIFTIRSDGSDYQPLPFLNGYMRSHESGYGPETGTYLIPSPDGNYLAFDGYNKVELCQDAPNTDCAHFNYGLWIADLGNQTVTGPIAANANPSWSPDSKQFVISTQFETFGPDGEITSRYYNLAVYNLVTGTTQRILANFSDDLFPSWAPDGQWIAFLRAIPYDCHGSEECNTDLFVVRPDGSGAKRLITNVNRRAYGYLLTLTWSPDSQWIRVSMPEGENVDVNVNTGQILESSTPSPFVWSPDRKLLFYNEDRGGNMDIFSYSLETMDTVNLTQNPAYDALIAVSLTGHFIAFYSDRLGNEQPSLFVMSPDGVFVYNLGQSCLRLAWLPRAVGITP